MRKALRKLLDGIGFAKAGMITLHCSGEKETLSFYLLRRQGKQLEVENCLLENVLLKEADFSAYKNLPVIVNYSGTGLLERTLNGESAEQCLKMELPNFKPADFIIQSASYGSGQWLVAVLRKDRADALFSFLATKKLKVLAFMLGIVPLIPLGVLFGEESYQYLVGGFSLNLAGGAFRSVGKAEGASESVLFAGKERSADEVIALASGTEYLLNPAVYSKADSNTGKTRNDFVRSVIAGWVLNGGLGFLVLLLLLNFYEFGNLTEQHNRLSGRIEEGRSMLTHIQQLKKDVAEKEHFIGENNLGKHSLISYYADRMAASCNDGVRFVCLEINPVKGKMVPDSLVRFSGKIICLKGEAVNAERYRDFILAMKRESWVREIVQQQYQYATTSNVADFEIELRCR